MSFKLNERINAPYVLGYAVHCSMPIEQFRIERLNPAMCYMFWMFSRQTLSAVWNSTKLIGSQKNTAMCALLGMKTMVPIIFQDPALDKENFNIAAISPSG